MRMVHIGGTGLVLLCMGCAAPKKQVTATVTPPTTAAPQKVTRWEPINLLGTALSRADSLRLIVSNLKLEGGLVKRADSLVKIAEAGMKTSAAELNFLRLELAAAWYSHEIIGYRKRKSDAYAARMREQKRKFEKVLKELEKIDQF